MTGLSHVLGATPVVADDPPASEFSETSGVEHGALGRPGDGSPVCGLGKEFHAGRRAELRRRLEEGWAFFRGLPGVRDAERFHQDKQFWYLTGIASPDAALLMNAETGEEILFLPKRNRRLEGWDGEMWDSSDEWVKELTGFEDVRSTEDVMDVLGEHLEAGETVWTSSHPVVALSGTSDYAAKHDRRQAADPLDGRPDRATVLSQRLVEHFEVEIADCREQLVEMRWVKTEEEIAAMRRAGRAGALALAEGIRSTRPGVGEWDLDAVITFMQKREGATGPGYNAIVGGGHNSCVLHYTANDRLMKPREVMLVDYGPEVDHYVTDITRTWPIDGEFTERAAELYDAVLAAQAAGIEAAKPGASMKDVNDAANGVLRERGFGDLIRHGVCHWIGMEVHDPGPKGSYTRPLVPGVSFTIEPGAYEEETGIGIRIEDVVVITEDGCEVLTRHELPVDRASMERMVKDEGLLDVLDHEHDAPDR